MARPVTAHQRLYVRCTNCGGRIILHPSDCTWGQWYGSGKCGCMILAEGRPTAVAQPRDGIKQVVLRICGGPTWTGKTDAR